MDTVPVPDNRVPVTVVVNTVAAAGTVDATEVISPEGLANSAGTGVEALETSTDTAVTTTGAGGKRAVEGSETRNITENAEICTYRQSTQSGAWTGSYVVRQVIRGCLEPPRTVVTAASFAWTVTAACEAVPQNGR